MSGGRWDQQTRIAVVVVGLLVVTVGVLTTLQWRSGAGAAALVLGGILVALAGVAGGTIFGPRDAPEIRIVTPEPKELGARPERAAHAPTTGGAPTTGDADADERPAAAPTVLELEAAPPHPVGPVRSDVPIIDLRGQRPDQGDLPHQLVDAYEAGDAHEAGDTENATEVLIQHLRSTAPYAVAYHDAVRAVIAAAVEGRSLRPVSGQILGPVTISGLPIAVDIRAGTGFSLALMRRTYRSLFEGSPPVDAILVVVNTGDAHAVDAIVKLRDALGHPIVVVPWRVGEPTDRIVEGVTRARRESGPATPQRHAEQAPLVPAPRTEADVTGGHAQTSPPSTAPVPPAAAGSAAPVTATPTPTPPPPASATTPPQHPSGVPAPRRSGPPAGSRIRYDDSVAWRYASDLHWRGQLQEAERAYRTIVETRTHTLGWDHTDTLTARDQHATVLRDLDRLAEALVECDEVLLTRVRLLGDDHVDTLTSRSHLATIYHQLGDLARAETEHRQVLEARLQVHGAQHQETLISRSNLAKVYQDLGELDLAIDEHRTVMQQRASLLGADHRDTLMSQSLLASALHLSGRLEEAEAQHRDVLRGRLSLLGPNHIDTAVSRHRLASVLHDRGRLDEAIAEYRVAREVYAELLGASSPFARAAASDLALAERAARATRQSRPAR